MTSPMLAANSSSRSRKNRRKYFVCLDDVNNIHAWSGIPYHMYRALHKVDPSWEAIGPFPVRNAPIHNWKRRLYARLGKRYWPQYESSTLRDIANRVDRALLNVEPGPVMSVHPDAMVFSKAKRPWLFYGDATFAALHQLYPHLKNLCGESVRAGHRIWNIAARRSQCGIFSSDWAAKSFQSAYAAAKNQAKVIPFGANVDREFQAEEVERFIASRPSSPIRLLWMGVDWERKGGEVAIQVARMLHEAGVPVSLILAGNYPEQELIRFPFVELAGFINKKKAAGIQRFHELFATSHFFLFPSLADCSPIVYNEASLHGLPSIASDVGGTNTVVKNGINGYCLPLENFAAEAISRIKETISNPSSYTALCRSSYHYYQDQLNWRKFSSKLNNILIKYVE